MRVLALGLGLFVVGCRPAPAKRVPSGAVVSLVPSVTEIIYAVGAESLLVGNSTHCNYPEKAKSVYKVGDFQNPDIERIVALAPRLVFLALPVHGLVVEKLRELGIRFYASNPTGIEDVLREIDSVGSLLGASGRASRLVDSLRAWLDSLPSHADSPRVYIEISDAPMVSVGAGTFIDEAVRRAGGDNVFGHVPQQYPLVDAEMVVRSDPEVIVILHQGTRATELGQRVGWSGVTAVRTGRVYDDLDEDLISRPGPRLVSGIHELSRRLHATRTGRVPE